MNIKPGEALALKEQQEVLLETMKAVHFFCCENDLRYTLLHGTLLGAARHKGFIPWDNDLDIGMPRPDYDRCLNLLNSGSKIGDHYYHVHFTNDSKYHYQIIRICDDRTTVSPTYIRDQPLKMGIWVDIFPVDGVPQKTLPGIIRRTRLFINKKIQIADIYSIRGKKDFANRVGNLCCKIFPNARKRNYLIDRLLRKTAFQESEYVGNVVDHNEVLTPEKREVYENMILVDYEDTQFYAIAEYDKYLKDKFGDYMKLPPENQRLPHQTECRWIV